MGRITAAAVAAIWALASGASRADTLGQALVEAYLGNAQLAAERARVRATDELVPQALAGYRPNVFGSVGYEITRGKSAARVPGITNNGGGGGSSSIDAETTTTSVTIQQNLYDGGGTVASVSRAENLVRANRANLAVLEQSILLEAVQAYSNAWRDRAVLGEALNNEQRLRRQLQATRDRFEVGEVARTDVAQAEARLARAQADVEAAKSNVAGSDALYRRVTGRLPGQLDQPEVLRLLPSSLEEALALADANPDIVRASFEVAAAKDDVDVQFSELLPSLDLEGTAAYADDPGRTTRWTRSGQLGLTLTIPLYQGGAEQSRVRQSRQTFRQRRNDLEVVFRQVQEDVSSSWDTLLSASAQVPAFRSEVRANEIALEGVNQEALVGTRTVLDVLDAEQELFTSRVSLVRAQADEVFASYQLKSAVGQLTVLSLELPVQPYDPKVHYRANRNRLLGLKSKG